MKDIDAEIREHTLQIIAGEVAKTAGCNAAAGTALVRALRKGELSDKDAREEAKGITYCTDIFSLIKNFSIKEIPQGSPAKVSIMDIIRGAMYGDIAGSRFEGKAVDRDRQDLLDTDHTGCSLTDDSILTYATYAAIRDLAPCYKWRRKYLAKGKPDLSCLKENSRYPFSENPFSYYYLEYGNRFPDAGYGFGYTSWLREYGNNLKIPEPYGSCGNGSAMRVSPIGAVHFSQKDVIFLSAMSACATHSHFEGVKGAIVTAMCVFMAKEGYSKEQIRRYLIRHYSYGDVRFHDFTWDEAKRIESTIVCQYTVPAAVISFLESTSFDDSIRKAICVHYDTDTTACVCGGIAAAYYGISEDIRTKVEKRLSNAQLIW